MAQEGIVVMWTKPQVRAFQAGLAVANKWEEAISKLEEIAKHAPAFAERMQSLRIQRDLLYQVCATAVAIDPQGEA